MNFAKSAMSMCLASFMFVGPAIAQVSKTEKTVNFITAKPDPDVGDWQGESGLVAQVFATGGDTYQLNLLKSFDTAGTAVAVLKGTKSSGITTFTGDGWTGTIQGSNFIGSKGDEKFNLQHVNRTSPTLGAKAPQGAIVLFDGKNLDAWATKAGKNWLEEAGPAKWKLAEEGAMEVVPGTDCIITHQKFGDSHIHVEFRTLGAPTNSGVFLQNRYEININETYGQLERGANGGLDNCTEKVPPAKRASLPPLAWQTFDIDFRAPRFDATGKKIASARATVVLNGVTIYNNQELDPPHGAAGRFGEAPTGQLMLQEHGVPLQFRNIWITELKSTD